MPGPALNSVAWFEIGTDQPEEVKHFYGRLFDWNFQLNTNTPGVNYHAVVTPGAQQPTGGVWESEGRFPDYAVFYVLVQDVAATVQHAEELGGKVLMAPITDAAGLTFARLEDSAGHHFGVFSAPAP
ncbi:MULTISPECIES: VOC family protein [Streptomyces]|uniref:Enzyme related to lactoylglutathione lyase n=1 Tax=Streptomyces achromogenes TaxID=67255 RepID=A0ABU0QBR6_STRAH|nr:VOC family protein [Streptomyces achromogenes]MDQ0687841.1 putative enzyme related to lactoylglutathione lyase [Streptomyces achromogenes]MDQ0835042.1 putative enzyme related to lactoylglutathione lyase [Streptomyces achromogenes]